MISAIDSCNQIRKLGRRVSCNIFYHRIVLDNFISISGLNWVQTTVATTGRLSVASLSLGGGAIATVDAAVASVRVKFNETQSFKVLMLQ